MLEQIRNNDSQENVMNLLYRVEAHLRRSGLSQTRFGRTVMKDPAFVRQLRNGRQARPETAARVLAWIEAAERARQDGAWAE